MILCRNYVKLCIILTKGQSNFPKGDMSRMQKKSVTSGTPIWRRGGPRGSAMVPFERAMVVSHRLSIVAVALSVTIRPQFAIGCLQRLYQPCWVILGVKFGEEGVDRCKPNFNTIWKSCGAAVWKKLWRYLLPFEHNARTWQTNGQTNWQTMERCYKYASYLK